MDEQKGVAPKGYPGEKSINWPGVPGKESNINWPGLPGSSSTAKNGSGNSQFQLHRK